MRVGLLGNKAYGLAVLGAMHDAGHEVKLVVTDTDSIAAAARMLGVRRVVPRITPDLTHRAEIDVLVTAHWHRMLSPEAWAGAPFGALGYHPSLLPRHRGRDSVEWTIRSGDPIAGGTCFWLDEGVDTGPIAAADWCHVDPVWSASDLWRQRLFGMGVRLTLGVLGQLDSGVVPSAEQDERFATYEPAVSDCDCGCGAAPGRSRTAQFA